MTSLSEANAKLAFDVFHKLSKDYPHENIIFSPLNLSTALGVLFHGCDTEVKSENAGDTPIAYGSHPSSKEQHLNKAKDDVNSKTRIHCEEATGTGSLRRRHRIHLPKFLSVQAIVNKGGCEAEEKCSPPTSGEDERKTDSKLIASVGENEPQPDEEEGASFPFIPWRSHFLRLDEPGNPSEKQSSQGEKVPPALTGPQTNREEHVHENIGEASLVKASSNVEVIPEEINALLCEFKQTVKHADNNVQVFKETFGIFKECCDNMCTSISKLQIVLEALVSVLRE